MLSIACQQEWVGLVQLLVKYRSSDDCICKAVNTIDESYGMTPLMIAVYTDNVDIIKLLLKVKQLDLTIKSIVGVHSYFSDRFQQYGYVGKTAKEIAIIRNKSKYSGLFP